MVSGSTDRTMRFWSDKKIVLQAPGSIEAIAFLNDKTLISGGDDGFIRIWNRDTAKEIYKWKAHAGGLAQMVLSADRRTLVTGGFDNSLHVWDVSKATRLRPLATRLGSIPRSRGDSAALAITSNSQIIVSGGFNNAIKQL